MNIKRKVGKDMIRCYVGASILTGGYGCRVFVDVEQLILTENDVKVACYLQGRKTMKNKIGAAELWLEDKIKSYGGIWENNVYFMDTQYEAFCREMGRKNGVIITPLTFWA